MTKTITTANFNGQDVHVLPYKTAPCFLAIEVGEALGYSDPTQLAKNISRRWSGEFIEGVDCHKAEGEDLAELKELVASLATSQGQLSANLALSPIGQRATSVILLTETGVHLACIKAKTDKGAAFRRWLASEVLPALRKSGTYSLDATNDPLTFSLSEGEEHTNRRDTRTASLHLRAVNRLEAQGALDRAEMCAEVIRAAEINVGHKLPILRRAFNRNLPKLKGTGTDGAGSAGGVRVTRAAHASNQGDLFRDGSANDDMEIKSMRDQAPAQAQPGQASESQGPEWVDRPVPAQHQPQPQAEQAEVVEGGELVDASPSMPLGDASVSSSEGDLSACTSEANATIIDTTADTTVTEQKPTDAA